MYQEKTAKDLIVIHPAYFNLPARECFHFVSD